MQMTSREFNQDLGRAKRESLNEPVIITDRGVPKHVLMSYEDYQAIGEANASKPVVTLLQRFAAADPIVAEIDLDIPPRSTGQRPPVEFD